IHVAGRPPGRFVRPPVARHGPRHAFGRPLLPRQDRPLCLPVRALSPREFCCRPPPSSLRHRAPRRPIPRRPPARGLPRAGGGGRATEAGDQSVLSPGPGGGGGGHTFGTVGTLIGGGSQGCARGPSVSATT